jgi:hypothetical protein
MTSAMTAMRAIAQTEGDSARSLSFRKSTKEIMTNDTPLQSTASSSPFVFANHGEAEQAIQLLSKSGFDVKKLSLVGKGYHSEEHPVGFYSTGDKVKSWGATGAFWGGIWGLLLAPAVFFLPGIGLIAMAGPLVATLVGGLEGAVFVGGLSALGAALTRVGVPENQVLKFETALKVDQYVLLVHGTEEDRANAKSILSHSSSLAAAYD